MRVVVSDHLPYSPTPGELGRRIVRHGLAEVLTWLGEELGPNPEDQTHALHNKADNTLLVSASLHAELKKLPSGKTISMDAGLFR